MKVVLRKTHLKIQKTPAAHQNSTSGERISREIFEISKKIFVLKLFLRPILFHGKISFDNLTYFKLYGNLKFAVKQCFFLASSFTLPCVIIIIITLLTCQVCLAEGKPSTNRGHLIDN